MTGREFLFSICYSWPLAGELTKPYIGEGVQYIGEGVQYIVKTKPTIR